MKVMIRAAAVALLAALPATALAQSKPTTTATGVEPEAIAALDKMAAYLRTLKSFDVVINATTEDVYDNGQKLQFAQRTRYVSTGNAKLYVESRNNFENRKYYYDGKMFTVYSPRTGYYAQTPLTGSVASVLDRAEDEYDIDLPLLDLFLWGTQGSDTAPPREGFKVTPALLGNWLTTHYAFRGDGVDYQIWIDQGEKPLPRKLVITNLEDPAQPQYVAYLRWDLEPKISDATFAYTPDAKAKKIPFQTADAAARAAK